MAEYYNNTSEMPEVPDVGILYCGELPHHKMGIRLNTYKNFDEGKDVGRIMGYRDLSDRRGSEVDLDFSEFMSESEIRHQAEKEKQRREEEERRREEEKKLDEEVERERLILLMEKEQRDLGGEPKHAKQIFKEVNSLKIVEMEKGRRKSICNLDPNRVLYARKGSDGTTVVQLGGDKIDLATAVELKTICWGGPNVTPKQEWLKSSVRFHESEQLNAFGLRTEKGSTKAFQMIFQAYILKQLMFEGKVMKPNKKKGSYEMETNRLKTKRGKPISVIQLLRPNEVTQRDVLIGAIADILWKMGDHQQSVLVIPEANSCFELNSKISSDGLTEKLHLFKCDKEEEIKNIVKKHILYFLQDQAGGLCSLLYSIVLSKGIEKVREDMQDMRDDPLVNPDDTITLSLSNLMLTGCATPYLHNGIMSTDTEDATNFEFGDGKLGITGRNEIGFLVWGENKKETEDMNLGSRLKTPVLPIWVTFCHQNWGLLFNPNRDLMKSYQAENRFHLYYYSDYITKEKKETILTIDTRSGGKRSSVPEIGLEEFDDVDEDPLAMAIETKWEGASVDWGTIPPYT